MKDLLAEMKGLKYQKTLVITFSKDKENGKREFVQLYATIINNKDIDDILDNSFQVIFNKINNWVSAGSDWVMITVGDKINTSNHISSSGCFYIKLPIELRNTKKGLINIINRESKCFLWRLCQTFKSK